MILLSGYEDFQYAREAMALGIRHYLLKPVEAEKLIGILTEYRDRARQIKLARKGELIRNRLFNEQVPFMKSTLMNCLIRKDPDSSDILGKAETLQIRLDGPSYQIIVVEIDNYPLATERMSPREKEAFAFATLNLTEETLVSRYSGFAGLRRPGRLACLINLPKGQTARTVCEEIRANLLRYLKCTASIGIGCPVEELADVGRSYGEAVAALESKPPQARGSVIVCDDGTEAVSCSGAAPLSRESGSRKLVSDVIRYVLDNYDKPIGLNEAADHVQVTPAHLSKIFKEEMGVNFIKWLNRLKVEEAKRMLAETWLKTYEIAEKVGYQDYKYFSLVFKRYAGCSPREYRNKKLLSGGRRERE
jgi:two-component system response regulator YesN